MLKKQFLLLLTACFFFFFAHPNFILVKGFAPAGFLVYFPVLLLVDSLSVKKSLIFGSLYGFFSYFLFCFWLLKYCAPAYFAVCIMYAFFNALLFLLIRILFNFFDGKSYGTSYRFLLASPLILLYEFLKTLGIFGFNYGISAYSQWQNIALVQTASVGGIWGVSLILILFSALLASFWTDFFNPASGRKNGFFKRNLIFAGIYFVLLALYIAIPLSASRNVENRKSVKLALIQPNSSPWKDGFDEYKKEVEKLEALTDSALASHPEAQIVVWPETAVVVDICRHYRSAKSPERHALVRELLDYMQSKNVSFVLGNNYSSEAGGKLRTFNSVFLFKKDSDFIPPRPEIYSKIKLVPLSESISFLPDSKIKRWIMKSLDTHEWTAGSEYKVFEVGDFSFCTPVCFEDTFENPVGKMAERGAGAIISLSNDSWSNSLACQYQHLSMSVFRSAENRIPSARCTASGQTAFISRSGKVISELEPFTEGYLFGSLEY